MLNKLPEKLVKLRKHFNYSQQEAASLCKVDLIEYMSWENGRNLPNIEQIKQLARIFHLSLDEMIENTSDIPLYSISEKDEDLFSIQKEIENTMPIPVLKDLDEVKEDESGKTKMIPLEKLKAVKEYDEVNRTNEKKPIKNKNWIYALAGIFVLVIGLILIYPKSNNVDLPVWNDLEMKNHDRLSASSKTVLILNEDGTVNCRGDNESGQCNVYDWFDIVKVSAGENHSVGLKKNGTVVASGSDRYGQSSVSLLKNVIDIASGKNHTVVLYQDGKLGCIGDNSNGQCNVEEIENAQAVYAFNNLTAVLLKDGTVKLLGDYDGKEIEGWNDLVQVSMGSNHIAGLKKDGTMVIAGNLDGANWQNIVAIDSYGDNLVALNASGSVFVLGDNSYKQCDTEKWNDALAVAAGDGFVVMLNHSGELLGIGSNRYAIFDEAEKQKTKLAMVSDVSVEIGDTIRFSWSESSNAAYYEVVIGNIGSYKVTDTTLALSSNRFVDGVDYTVSIIAYPSKNNYDASDEYLTIFTYIAPIVTPTPTPTPIVTITPEPEETPKIDETEIPEIPPTPTLETEEPEESAEPSVTETP